MSNQIHLISNAAASSGKPVYARIWRQSDNYVWNNSTELFEAWVAGNIASYSIYLTNQGGNLFTADAPDNLGAGLFTTGYFVRTGATPALTDTHVETTYLNYTLAVAPTQTATGLDQYALTDLESVKLIIPVAPQDTSKDAVLIQLINAATYMMEQQCTRRFKARNHKEYAYIDQSNVVFLYNTPILRCEKIGLWKQKALTVSCPAAIRASVSVEDDSLTLYSTDSSGDKTTTTLSFATYKTTDALNTAINAVSGWSSTVYKNVPSDELWKVAGQDCSADQPVTEIDCCDWTGFNVTYDIHQDSGSIALNGTNNISPGIATKIAMVWYRGGFETIPADLKNICNEIVRITYNKVGKDQTISGFANQATAEVLTGRSLSELSSEVKRLLKYYRMPRIADNIR